jgi:hypothetical protein
MGERLKANEKASRPPDAGPSRTDVRDKIEATCADRATGPLLTPKQLGARYHLGRTKIYEECRHGVLRGVAVRWGRRIYIPASAAARIFEGEDK